MRHLWLFTRILVPATTLALYCGIVFHGFGFSTGR
jgi:hypothetical protein